MHADYTGPTRRHELDRTDHTDHPRSGIYLSALKDLDHRGGVNGLSLDAEAFFQKCVESDGVGLKKEKSNALCGSVLQTRGVTLGRVWTSVSRCGGCDLRGCSFGGGQAEERSRKEIVRLPAREFLVGALHETGAFFLSPPVSRWHFDA